MKENNLNIFYIYIDIYIYIYIFGYLLWTMYIYTNGVFLVVYEIYFKFFWWLFSQRSLNFTTTKFPKFSNNMKFCKNKGGWLPINSLCVLMCSCYIMPCFLPQCSLTLFPKFSMELFIANPFVKVVYSLRYAKWRDHTILCLECVQSLEITICDGPIKETHGQKMI
jgi:hypothetical protein